MEYASAKWIDDAVEGPHGEVKASVKLLNAFAMRLLAPSA